MSATGTTPVVAAPRSSIAVVERPDALVPWAAVTDSGPCRVHNEDCWQVHDRRSVFAIADGMGGHSAGEVAAGIAVRTVTDLTGALCDAGLAPSDAMARAVASAHGGIREFARARPECLGMGTTVVVATVAAGRLIVAHVGDSRAYLVRDGRLRRLTSDHSIGQQMLDAGRLTEAEVRRLPARGILTRALGIESEAPSADIAEHDWQPGDRLLLCSDGLSDPLDDASIATVFGRATGGLAAIALELIVAALMRGGTDNVTALLAGGPAPIATSH
jgi:serine/threonine protein phosphatase PrpC